MACGMQGQRVSHPPAGGKDPKALETLVSTMSVSGEAVNRDLMTYKVLPCLYQAAIPSQLPGRSRSSEACRMHLGLICLRTQDAQGCAVRRLYWPWQMRL